MLEHMLDIIIIVVGHEAGEERQATFLNRRMKVSRARRTRALRVESLSGIQCHINVMSQRNRWTTNSSLSTNRYGQRATFLQWIGLVFRMYAAKECCRGVLKHTRRDWATLKRLSRHLLGEPRLQLVYGFQEKSWMSQLFRTRTGPATTMT